MYLIYDRNNNTLKKASMIEMRIREERIPLKNIAD